jgi:hypothetical protein
MSKSAQKFASKVPEDDGIYWARNASGLWIVEISTDASGFMKEDAAMFVDGNPDTDTDPGPWTWGPGLEVPEGLDQ